MFDENMNADIYEDIINYYLFPFVASYHPFDATLHQDNDTKHNALTCRRALDRLGIEWVCKINSLIKPF